MCPACLTYVRDSNRVPGLANRLISIHNGLGCVEQRGQGRGYGIIWVRATLCLLPTSASSASSMAHVLLATRFSY